MSNDIAVTANPIVASAAAPVPVVSPAPFVNVTVGLDAYSPPLPTTIVSTETVSYTHLTLPTICSV